MAANEAHGDILQPTTLDTWGETGLPRTPRGAMVRIVTHDPDALKAVHEFLEFQIMDHRTGDSATVGKPS